MDIEECRVLFLTVTFVSALFVASPALGRLLVPPRTEFFTELWILGPNHTAENYPFNISSNQNYSIYLGIANRLGYCACYLVAVKFRNQTQSGADSFNHTPSSLPALYSITAFVADEQTLESSLTFSFNYKYNRELNRIEFQSLILNDAKLNMTNYTLSWDIAKRGFYGNLFFELWIYNSTVSDFTYHGRFVGLWLNMTGS
jgi:hypothetical protein